MSQSALRASMHAWMAAPSMCGINILLDTARLLPQLFRSRGSGGSDDSDESSSGPGCDPWPTAVATTSSNITRVSAKRPFIDEAENGLVVMV